MPAVPDHCEIRCESRGNRHSSRGPDARVAQTMLSRIAANQNLRGNLVTVGAHSNERVAGVRRNRTAPFRLSRRARAPIRPGSSLSCERRLRGPLAPSTPDKHLHGRVGCNSCQSDKGAHGIGRDATFARHLRVDVLVVARPPWLCNRHTFLLLPVPVEVSKIFVRREGSPALQAGNPGSAPRMCGDITWRR